MKIEKGRWYAVLTGDIVQSTRLSVDQLQKLGQLLGVIGKELSRWPSVPLPLSQYRGDSWQLLLSDPRQALRVSLYVRASLRSHFEKQRMDTRVAIGIGPIDFLPGNRVTEGNGPAYRLSGAGLSKMGWRRLYIPSAVDINKTGLHKRQIDDVQVMLDLVDFIVQHWTPAQATGVLGALRGWTQERIAQEWPVKPITQQGVANHLRRAGWDAVESALKWFEDRIQA
jgi:hypothetical protein